MYFHLMHCLGVCNVGRYEGNIIKKTKKLIKTARSTQVVLNSTLVNAPLNEKKSMPWRPGMLHNSKINRNETNKPKEEEKKNEIPVPMVIIHLRHHMNPSHQPNRNATFCLLFRLPHGGLGHLVLRASIWHCSRR